MIWNRIIPLQQRIIQGVLQTHVRNITVSRILREDHYKALGVSRDATLAEIKNAYFELSKVYHPDRIAATDENLAKFRAISAAYEVLGNEQSRKLYDRGLDATASTAAEDDPIVKFYQQRQRKSEVPTEADRDEMDQWTQEVYKAARKSLKEKNELFRATKVTDEEEEARTPELNFAFAACIFLSFLVCCSLQDHVYNNFFSGLFGEDNRKH